MRLALSQFRIGKNMTMQTIADSMGVSKSVYAKVEQGVNNPSFEFMNKFLTAFPSADVKSIFFTK